MSKLWLVWCGCSLAEHQSILMVSALCFLSPFVQHVIAWHGVVSCSAWEIQCYGHCDSPCPHRVHTESVASVCEVCGYIRWLDEKAPFLKTTLFFRSSFVACVPISSTDCSLTIPQSCNKVSYNVKTNLAICYRDLTFPGLNFGWTFILKCWTGMCWLTNHKFTTCHRGKRGSFAPSFLWTMAHVVPSFWFPSQFCTWSF